MKRHFVEEQLYPINHIRMLAHERGCTEFEAYLDCYRESLKRAFHAVETFEELRAVLLEMLDPPRCYSERGLSGQVFRLSLEESKASTSAKCETQQLFGLWDHNKNDWCPVSSFVDMTSAVCAIEACNAFNSVELHNRYEVRLRGTV